VGIVLGNIGTAYGLPSWVAILGGAAILVVALRVIGSKDVDEAVSA